MKKSFMTRVLAVSLSAAMAFSVSSASNLMTASAASTVNLKTTFKTLKVNQKYQLKLTNNTLNWKITKVTTSNKKICTVYDKKASSVMLKGKGVGRAKIKVKVKTTKRKYPKNIKYMTCTANVKAAGEETKPPVEAAFSATVAPISSTQVRVTFNKAVDNASEAANFTVSDGVKVTKSDPSEDKLSTVLTIDGAEAGKSYDLTAKGLTVNGAAQADLTLKFTAPSDVQTGYEMTITSDPKIIKSDGQTQARVTFEVTKDGKAITDQTAQIEFSASRGHFADNRATLNNGKVTVMYNAPHETVSVPAVIQATVVESSDRDMIGTPGTTSVTLSPNPDALTSEAAVITSASAGTADRVVAYFDKEVTAADFMKDGRPNTDKFECEVYSGIDNNFGNTDKGTKHNVIAFLDVANEPNALEILVDTPMTDNSNLSVMFKDKRTKSSIDTKNTVYLKLADAREPSAMSVETEGTKKIHITFSEAVLPSGLGGAGVTYAANNANNYLIDGRSLEDWGVKIDGSAAARDPEATTSQGSGVKIDTTKIVENDELFDEKDGEVRVHSYTVDKDKVGTDNRHTVTITVGSGHPLSAGNHILTVRNVGDWAAKTDGARNSVSTQTFPFTITENAEKPAFTVDVHSPEQFELNFNTAFKIAERGDHFTTDNSAETASVLELQEKVNGTWTNITASDSGKNNPIRVTKVVDAVTGRSDDKKYMVEVRRDWSEVYDYLGTRTNYWNKELRLHVNAGKLVNKGNNLTNDAIDIYLNANDANVTNGNKMGEVDTQSPTIVDVKQAAASNGNLLHSWNVELSEPIKIAEDTDKRQGANKEGLTPSQTQTAGAANVKDDNKGVPVPYAQFINVENPTNVIDGIIKNDQFINAQDTIINVEPETKLSGGTWKLVVGSISDDYGTTLATDSKEIVIDEKTVETDFKVVWAAVATAEDYDEAEIGNTSDGLNQGSWVYVKFNKPVDLATALDENNYALNNQPLPHGSNIQANIENYDDHDNVVDSVTIMLPQGGNLTQKYFVSTQNTQLSISGVVAAGTGEALSNSGMNRLPYNFGSSGTVPGKGDNSQVSELSDKYDAVWGNADSEQYDHFTKDNQGNRKSGDELYKGAKSYYEALKDALEKDQYRKVELTTNIFDTGYSNVDRAANEVFGSGHILTINRAVNIDLKRHSINGNVVISTTETVGNMTISNGTIAGLATSPRTNKASLTVNAPTVKHFNLENVAVNKNGNDYPILLDNVWSQSFVLKEGTTVHNGNNDNAGVIRVNDSDGFGMNNKSEWAGTLDIHSNGKINLKGKFAVNTINVHQAATLNLGIVDKDGNREKDGEFIPGTKTQIHVYGSEAKVMLTQNAQIVEGTQPDITVYGKKVRIHVATSEMRNLMSGKIKTDGGEIEWADMNGKKDDDFKVEGVEATGHEKAFKAVTVLGSDKNPAEIRLEDFKTTTVTGSAFKGEVILQNGELSETKFKEDCQLQAFNALKADGIKKINDDGTTRELVLGDVDVKVTLSGNYNLVRSNGIISAKDATTAGRTDTITVTFKCNDRSYTKTIKVTS